jgi:hypothetical protein
MATSLDRWLKFARGFPLEWYDYFDVKDLLDTPDGIVVLLNRVGPESNDPNVDTPPDDDLPSILKLSRDGKLIWRVSLTALNPILGSDFTKYHTQGMSLIRTHGEDGFLLVGTVRKQRLSIEKDEVRAFVCRISEGGVYRWLKTYNDPAGHNAEGVTITALPKKTADPGLYLVAARSVFKKFGGPTLVFVIDEDGNVIGSGTRYFSVGTATPPDVGIVANPVKLRNLPTFGPVLVGTAEVWEHFPSPIIEYGWLLRFSNTGTLMNERVYSALPATPEYPYANIEFADIAEGQTTVMVVGRQMYAAVPGEFNELNSIASRTPRGPGEGQFVITAGIGLTGLDASQLACLSETGAVIWEKRYTSWENDFVTTLKRVCWRSNGDIVSGGDNLRIPYLGGTSLLGAGFLACSESEVNLQVQPQCSYATNTSQQPFAVVPQNGPFKNESFHVDAQVWGALVKPNGWLVQLCP